ncbi:MAG TPA: class I SAM-dependent methyltransferase [Pyrinomonadaceae bacterium]|nr:class I SAM-dependent methyltransferase [Pyrinomonadaceae bacterium]
MSNLEEAKQKAAHTYNAASDHYDHPANTFWERYGRRTIERLQLKAGAKVLDVCCGSGASALPEAETVGPTGSVTGVDLAHNLLELARAKARQRQLANVHFETGDMTNLRFANGSFDAVVCVFGIFFVPDMAGALRELTRVLRSGGTLAVTTWGPRFFEPVSTAFWNSVSRVRPDLYKGFNPWDRISETETLRLLLESTALTETQITAETDSQPIPSPEDWWAMVLGSGYRGTVDQLSANEQEQVRTENLEFIRRNGVQSVEANVIYAQARRP